MGNKASALFGGGPPLVSDSEHSSSAGEYASGSKDTTPAALSEEEREEADAEAKRYSELFGGKPKLKAPAAGSDHRRSTRKSTPSRKKRAATQQQQKKKKRLHPDLEGDNPNTAKGRSKSQITDGDTADEGDGGSDSAPESPYRGKAAWMGGKSALADGEGPRGGVEEERTMAEKEQQEQQKVKELERLKVMDAVSAKIADLEKERGDAIRCQGAGQEEGAGGVEKVAVTRCGDEGGKSGYDRAAVAGALFAGVEPSATSSKEVLVTLGGGGGLGGIMRDGAGVTAPTLVGRSISPRPAPQRNFKLKN